MGILERKLREREERKRLILDSARRLFIRKGLDAASLKDIADEAELSKAALYLYFRDKAGILGGVLAQVLEKLGQLHTAAAVGANTGLERLKAWGRAFITLCLDYPDDFYFVRLIEIFQLPFDRIDTDQDPASLLMSAFKADLLDTFRQGQADGSLRADLDPRMSAVVLGQLMISFLQSLAGLRDQVAANTGFEPQALIDHLFDVLVRGLSPRPQGV